MSIALVPLFGAWGSPRQLIGRVIGRFARQQESVRSVTKPSSPAAPSLALARAATHAIAHPDGMRIDCVAGCVWLTHDNDPEDIVLQGPAAHLVDRQSRLLIHALEDAQIRVSQAPRCQGSAASS